VTANTLNRLDQADGAGDNKITLDGSVEGATWETYAKTVYLQTYLADISDAGGTAHVFPRFAGTLNRISLVIEQDITGTAEMDVFIAGNMVTGGTFDISGFAGSQFTFALTGDNTFAIGDIFEVTSDGASTGNCPVYINLEVIRD